MIITKEQRDELLQLHAAATPAPWSFGRATKKGYMQAYGILGPDGGRVTWAQDGGDGDVELDDHDTDLILAMRNALPALLDALEAAERDRDAAIAERGELFLSQQVARFRADRDALLRAAKALCDYRIDHKLDCSFDPPNVVVCDCGLDALRAEVARLEAK